MQTNYFICYSTKKAEICWSTELTLSGLGFSMGWSPLGYLSKQGSRVIGLTVCPPHAAFKTHSHARGSLYCAPWKVRGGTSTWGEGAGGRTG